MVMTTRQRIYGSELENAFAASGGSDLPMRLFADFAKTGGPAAVRDRELTVAIRYAELADLLGAVPVSLMDDLSDEDMTAVGRVLRLLRRLDGPDSADKFGAELRRGMREGHPAVVWAELPVPVRGDEVGPGGQPDRGERLYQLALTEANRKFGLAARYALGPVLWHALIAREMLALTAAQDDGVPDATVRAMVNQGWDRLADAENET